MLVEGGVFAPKGSGIGVPEGGYCETGLEDRQGDHDVVVDKPVQRGVTSCHHRGGNQGSDCSTGPVRAMEDAEQLVCVLQVADPGVPGAVLEAVAKAREEQNHREDGVWRMEGHYEIADQAT